MHNSTATMPNAPMIPRASITKLITLSSITVLILNCSMFSLDPLPRRSNSKPKVNWLFHAAKLIPQKDTTSPKQQKCARKSQKILRMCNFCSNFGTPVAVNYSPFRQRFSPINGDNLISEGTVASCRTYAI